MRCVIYTRVSTAEQGREGASLPVQLQACRKHAAAQGWAVVDELQDIQSGLDVDRAAYQKVIALARAHSVDVVLVWRLDRFGRDEAEAMLRLKEMARLQTKVVSATEGEQSPFLQKLMFLLAGEESRRTSERVRPAMRKRVEEGLWMAKPPWGYKMDPARRGHLIHDERTAPLVRELFRRSAAGTSVFALSGWLNTVTLPDGAALRSPRGRWFCDSMLHKVLQNPVYVGRVRWNRTQRSKLDGFRAVPDAEHLLVPGQHAPMVDQETFDTVQNVLAASYRKRRSFTPQQFLLTGITRCGVCGMAAPGQRSYGKSSYFRYRCRIRSHAGVNGGRLDTLVLEQVCALPVPDEGVEQVRAALVREQGVQPDRSADLRAQRKRYDDQRRRLTRFLADGTLEPADYRTAITELEQAVATLEREMAELSPLADTDALMASVESWLALARELGSGTLSAILPDASLADQAAVVGAVIERITIHRNAPPEIIWRPWVASLRAVAAYRHGGN